MPLLVLPIEGIARREGRDVLFFTFKTQTMTILEMAQYDPEQHQERRELINWLEANRITWKRCAIQGEPKYMGAIWIDVPFDTENLQYRKVVEHCENPDGSMKIPAVDFEYLPLEMALKTQG